MLGGYWRKRAEAAELRLAEAQQKLEFYEAALEGMQRRYIERATLIDIRSENRRVFFTFTRNGEVYRIGAMGTWNDDIAGWKKSLIDPLPRDKTASLEKEKR